MELVGKSSIRPKSEDNVCFRLNSFDNFDNSFERMKDREQGENDLHLSFPRIWPHTLYPEIFRVSEKWLAQLSRVIRLSNEKHVEQDDPGTTGLLLKEFTARAKSLELIIVRWENTATDAVNIVASNSSVRDTDVDRFILESMLNALRHALAVYFYR